MYKRKIYLISLLGYLFEVLNHCEYHIMPREILGTPLPSRYSSSVHPKVGG